MTNNNWIEQYKEKFGLCVDEHCNCDREIKFISNLLTKKDQEHKAGLEKVREVFWEVYNKNSDYYSESTKNGEIDNSNEAAYATAVLNQIIKGLRDKGIELEETTAILDSHINKL